MRWDFPMSRIRPIESTIRISENYPGSLPVAVRVQDFLNMKKHYGGLVSLVLLLLSVSFDSKNTLSSCYNEVISFRRLKCNAKENFTEK
jgi:hypothetical protein